MISVFAVRVVGLTIAALLLLIARLAGAAEPVAPDQVLSVTADVRDGKPARPVPLTPEVRRAIADALSPPPSTEPVPAGAVLVRKGQQPPGQVKSGQTVLFEAGGLWELARPLYVAGDGITIGRFGDGPAPTLRCTATGIQANGPVNRLTIRGLAIDCAGQGRRGKPDLTGVHVVQPRSSGITLDGVVVRGFEWNLVVHHPRLHEAKRAEWIRDVKLLRVRSLDARSPKDFGGQGLFATDVDGLLIDGCVFDGNGARTIFQHGVYASFCTADVVIRDSAFTHNGSFGFQARNGAQASGNLIAGNGMGALVNGASGSFTGNVVIGGHLHDPPTVHGMGGLVWSVGQGKVSDNLFVGSGDKLRPNAFVVPAIDASPRPPKQGWEWGKAVRADASGNTVLNWPGPRSPLKGNIVGAVQVTTVPQAPRLDPGDRQRLRDGTLDVASVLRSVREGAGVR